MRTRLLCALGVLLACLCALGCGGLREHGSTTDISARSSTPTVRITPTLTASPTSTKVYTEMPTATPTQTLTPTPTSTRTPTPTETFAPTPADTSTPTATDTSTPRPTKVPKVPSTKTPTPAAQAYPPPILLDPPPDHVCFRPPPHEGVTCEFRWSWPGQLQPNQYFQVQFIGANNEHRGVHAPTKELFYTYSYGRWGAGMSDWCAYARKCYLQWTVVVVEWDGVDTSRLGRVLAEAEPRYFYL